MLIAIKLQLLCQADIAAPAQLGRANFAALLDRLELADRALVRSLHDSGGYKPVTCSALLGKEPGMNSQVLRRGERAALRVTGLTAPVAEALRRVLVETPPTHWAVRGAVLTVTGVTCDGGVDAWCGSTDYARLMAEALVGWEMAKPVLRLAFGSATAFRSGGMTMPLPLPWLVFGSLLDRWTAFSSVPLDERIREVAQAALAVSELHLDSVAVAQKEKGLEIGSQGEVTYTYLGEQAYWLQQLRVLAAFAQYSGVGIKTTMGMGQCRWVRN